MRVLVWQWGRHGSAPRLAAALAEGFRAAGAEAVLSLARDAEILRGADAPRNDLPVATYRGIGGFLARFAAIPFATAGLARRVRAVAPDFAVCVMAGPLDLWMAAALRRAGVRFAVIVHDATSHPGDGLPMQMRLQHALCRRADALMAWSGHVAAALTAQGLTHGRPVLRGFHPPLAFAGPASPPAFAHGGKARLLFFGRLLAYKGLDLLAAACARLEAPAAELRVVGTGPDSPALAALAALPWVRVENRWVAEGEVGALLAWADALLLPYTEASQSGVAAAALAAGRAVLATRVGGLPEQLGDENLARLAAPEPAAFAAAMAGLIADPPRGPAADPQAGWRLLAETLIAGMAPYTSRC
ncbi:MAG: glycosyltransferase [Rhodospirillales bacterium]|nr:glycosyltransferase [Rhodospirillales bacterium]